MSDFDRNTRGTDYQTRTTPGTSTSTWGSGSWIAGAVIAVLLLIAIGYVFSDRSSTNTPAEHRAAATDTTGPATTPAKPLNSPAAAPAAPASPAKTP
jgi:hypothetical protein